MSDVERDGYTWDMAVKDLALTSRLTLQEASHLCRELDGLAHPYDALPALQRIVSAEISAESLGANLRVLLESRVTV